MGNDVSQIKGLEIDENPTECTELWSHYQANIRDSCRYFSLKCDGSVSVFKGESVLGPLWTVSTPLEKFCNNILKYRHPCIVKYISSWAQRSTFHLATEFIQPLAHVISSQTPLQKCIGLNNILQALVFLHEKGKVSHNNISTSAIYVSGDGQWKLGGLQYLCNFTELTPAYLKQSRIHRYDKAIDPNEDSNEVSTKVDQYAFAALVEEIFNGCSNDEVPYLHEFRKYCHDILQNADCKQRPNLSEVLQHDFFNHEFISVYKFLSFLALKTTDERKQFFSNILHCLKCYDEETVAKQFGGLLLSRLTLLDQTARNNVVPYILKPRNDRTQNEDENGFFSLGVFKEHLKPRIMQLFSVRDGQIRMLLLRHFSKYVQVFSHDELSQHILPELLLGIKDVDDSLVSATLICLSDLVPILGADSVVGGKRAKLFTDGRPNSNSLHHTLIHTSNFESGNADTIVKSKCLDDFRCSENIYSESMHSSVFQQALPFNERPSPVGSESMDVEVTTKTSIKLTVESEDDWDDWDNSNNKLTMEGSYSSQLEETSLDRKMESKFSKDMTPIDPIIGIEEPQEHTALLQKAAMEAKKNILDLSELDIKNKTDQSKKNTDEFDFFADMTPVIEKQEVALVKNDSDYSSKLSFVPNNNEGDENDGWEDTWN